MELVGQLNTDIDRGMTKDQAATRLSDEGPNQLTEKKGLPWYCVLLKEMTGFFSLLLWFGAILCFIGYAINQDDPSNLYLGIVLSAVTLVTGFFTFYQTSKSASLMAKFKNFIPPKAVVRREGRQEAIEAKELVRGDIVIVKGR